MMYTALVFSALIVGVLGGTSNYVPKIVNGTDAEWGDVPYIVSIRGSTGSHSCGGSIINPYWILTAAHCGQRDASDMSVQFGVLKISNDGDNIRQVSKVYNHEDYNPKNLENDIALLQLEEPIEYSEFVQPAKLQVQGEVTPGDVPALLAGWGYPYSGGSVMKNLQKVDIHTFSNEECSELHNNEIFESNICAGVRGGGKGQCSGDSGGPLTADGVVIGVVSWSVKPCTRPGYPGVFTRVASFRNWINEISGV